MNTVHTPRHDRCNHELEQAQRDEHVSDDAPAVRCTDFAADLVSMAAPQVSAENAAAVQRRAGQQVEQTQ